MELWRKVWRNGFAPLFPDDVLGALQSGLEENDPKLIQGQTTSPLPTPQYSQWVCEGADAVIYGFWRGGMVERVGDAERMFAGLCYEVDQALGQPASCRGFLNWFDVEPRKTVISELLAEVTLCIDQRKVLV